MQEEEEPDTLQGKDYTVLLCSTKFQPSTLSQENIAFKGTVIRVCVWGVMGGSDVMDGIECMREKMRKRTTVMQLRNVTAHAFGSVHSLLLFVLVTSHNRTYPNNSKGLKHNGTC